MGIKEETRLRRYSVPGERRRLNDGEEMNTGSKLGGISLRFASFITFAFICFSMAGCGPSEKQLKEEAERKAKEAENAQIEALKSKVLERLTDPASAQFRKLKLLQDNKGLCGEVNAKNKLGGYAGFSAFAVDPNGKAVVLKTMTLDIAKEDADTIHKLAGSMIREGNRGDAQSLLIDGIIKKDFAHWNECTN